MAFLGLIALLIVQRLWEVRHGHANLVRLTPKLMVPVDSAEMRQMMALHAGWFTAVLVEYAWRGVRVADPWWSLGLVVLAGCQAVRFASMRQLGHYWVHLPVSFAGQKIVNDGLYRYVKHPNYWAVVVEVALVPAIGSCWFTAIGASLLNALFLRRRVRMEERALTLTGRTLC